MSEVDSIADLPQRLAAAIADPPLLDRGARMSPELAYGRHRGPAPYHHREAAVLAALYRHEQSWRIAMTLRPAGVAHPHQICFPGGSLEPGETPLQAAYREFQEELGAAVSPAQLLGSLSPIYVFVSNFLVTPLVAVLEQRPVFKPNPVEVAEVVELPLSVLLDQRCYVQHAIERGRLFFHAPAVRYDRHEIWGATAVILGELLGSVQQAINSPS